VHHAGASNETLRATGESEAGDILFIDEIHRLSRMTEEILYPAMEDYRLDITIGKGSSAKTRSVPLPRFTLVGNNSHGGADFTRDRFGLIQRLRFYEPDELSQIVLRTQILQTPLTDDGVLNSVPSFSWDTPDC